MKVDAQQIVVDLHDSQLYGNEHLIVDNIDKIKNVYFKSDSHRDFFLTNIKHPNDKKVVKNKAVSIQNGIRKDIFVNTNNIERERYRFCYCSCYFRGFVRNFSLYFPNYQTKDTRGGVSYLLWYAREE